MISSIAFRLNSIARVSQRKALLQRSTRLYSSHSNNSNNNEIEDKTSLHKEEHLKIAREWPEELYAPEHYHAEEGKDSFRPTGFDIVNQGGEPPAADFSGPAWSYLLLGIVSGLLAYRLNEWYDQPLQKSIQAYLAKTPSDYWYDYDAKHLPGRIRAGEDRIILSAASEVDPQKPHRFVFADFHLRASDRFLGLEPDVDFSEVKMKHTWQERDQDFPSNPTNQ